MAVAHSYCYELLLITLQIAESSELVGDVEDIASLEKEYARDDLIYQEKIKVSDCQARMTDLTMFQYIELFSII